MSGARDVAYDLHEALKALKACRDTLRDSVMPLSGKTGIVATSIYEASKVLDKYPNLK